MNRDEKWMTNWHQSYCGCCDRNDASKPARWWNMSGGVYYCPTCRLYWWQGTTGAWYSSASDTSAYRLATNGRAPSPQRKRKHHDLAGMLAADRRKKMQERERKRQRVLEKRRQQEYRNASCPRRIEMVMREAGEPLTIKEMLAHPLLQGVAYMTVSQSIHRLRQKKVLLAQVPPSKPQVYCLLQSDTTTSPQMVDKAGKTGER